MIYWQLSRLITDSRAASSRDEHGRDQHDPQVHADTIPAFNYMGEVNWYLAPPETPMPWKLTSEEGKQLFEDACVGGLTAEEMRADSERLFESAMGNAKLAAKIKKTACHQVNCATSNDQG